MDPLKIVAVALDLIEQAIAAASARNDAAALADLHALIADSAIGRALVANADAQLAAIEDARRSLATTPVMGVPVADLAGLAAREHG